MNKIKKYLKLEDIVPYKKASEIADEVWRIVSDWEWFIKKTIGSQLVNAIDSIAANIAEGFGRYHKKDKIKFYHNARGSLFESAHWLNRANIRKIISKNDYNKVMEKLRALPKEINSLIKITEEKLSK